MLGRVGHGSSKKGDLLVCGWREGKGVEGIDFAGETHPTDDVVMVSKMGFAILAPKDLAAIEIDIVLEPHG